MSYDTPNTFSILEALLVEKELVGEKRGIEKRNIDWWDMLSKDSIFKIDEAINLRENPKLFVELIKSGVITENSVGIMPIQKNNKGDYREITEVKLYEISAVTLAANDQAKILDVKGNIDVDKLSKRYDNLTKLIRKGDISDEMGFAIEAEILKLKSLFVEFTKPVEEITSPNVETKNNDSDVINYLINSLKN